MGGQLFITLAPVFLILLVACLSVVAHYRKEFVARPLIMYLVLTIWLIVTNSCELIFQSHEAKLLFAKLEYFSFMLIPPSLCIFSLRYTGYVKYTRMPFVILAFIIPVISLSAVWTNELHGLFWQTVEFSTENGLSEMRATYGLFFWLAISWVYLLIVGGMIAIVRSYLNGPEIFRRQSLTIVIGLLFPGLLNVIHVLKFVPPGLKDFTPIGLAITGILFSSGIYINRFLRVLPVARTVILDEIDTGVVLFNRDGFLIDVNKAAGGWLNLGIKNVGVHVSALPTVARIIGVNEVKLPLQETEGVRQLGDLTFSLRVRILHSTADRNAGYVITMNDISSRVRQMEELSMVRAQMVQSEKLATIGQITAGIAHEIKNPLGYLTSEFRSLRTMAEHYESLDMGWVRTNLQEILKSAEEGLGRIDSVVKNLLMFSRQGAGVLDYEPYDLNRGIISTLEICKSEYRNHARVELDLGEIPMLRSLKNEINQVILNIVTNAAHAIRRTPVSHEHFPIIWVRTYVRDDAALCEISNSGPAIPEEMREKIFESFLTSGGGGEASGMGLSISREIVEKRHGGKLELASADPVMFRISLPIPRLPAGQDTRGAPYSA